MPSSPRGAGSEYVVICFHLPFALLLGPGHPLQMGATKSWGFFLTLPTPPPSSASFLFCALEMGFGSVVT